LIVGVLLVIVSLFFFYFASIIGYEYVTHTYRNEVNLAYPNKSAENLGFWPYGYTVINLTAQSYEFLKISYQNDTRINGTVQIELFELEPILYTFDASGIPDYSHLSFEVGEEEIPHDITCVIHVYLFAQFTQNVTLSVVTSVSHYQPPQWVYLGVGIVCLSMGVFIVNTYHARELKYKASLRNM